MNDQVIGTADNSVDISDTSAFVEWLNTESSCYVTMYPKKPSLNDEWLAEFDVSL